MGVVVVEPQDVKEGGGRFGVACKVAHAKGGHGELSVGIQYPHPRCLAHPVD